MGSLLFSKTLQVLMVIIGVPVSLLPCDRVVDITNSNYRNSLYMG